MLNLTQHPGTPEQKLQEPTDKALVKCLLTFEGIPSQEQITKAVDDLAAIAQAESNDYTAMIGGAPWLMAPLERALIRVSITPYYAFSERQSVEVAGANGQVEKKSVFTHIGFVEAFK
jgi:hypothetical protein